MSVQEDIALLAQELSHLAVSGSSVYLDTGGLAAALTARREVLDLLRAVLYDVAGTRGGAAESLTSSRFGGQPAWLRLGSVVELESNPVAGLARALGVHPTPRIEQDSSDRDDVAEASVTGRGWARVNRHALVIGHDWASSPPQLTAEQQWSAVADVAALAQVVAVLDQDLYTAASQLRDVDPSVVQALLDATRSGLRTAAGEATALSQVGPLPAWDEPTAPASTPIVVPRSPSDVIAAQHRLAAQVVTAGNLSPQAVTLVATGQARLLATAAQALAAVNPQRAANAGQLASELSAAIPGRHALAALMPDSPRPVAQTRELLQLVSRVADKGWTSTTAQAYLPALAAAVDRSPAVLQALSRHAVRALHNGAWLVPNVEAHGANDQLWRRWTSQDPRPKLAAGLSAVAARAAVTAADSLTRSRRAAAPPPRETLADLARRDRPLTPGGRSGPSRGR